MSKMGRPKSDNNKDKIVAVRLTEEEHQRLTMYAKKHSLKISKNYTGKNRCPAMSKLQRTSGLSIKILSGSTLKN